MSALKLKKEKQINLLPKDSFSETTIGRIVLWFVSTFRVIVIIVEFVVIGAFLSRFWLDSKNSDLTEEIKQKEYQIKALKPIENSFKGIQKKMSAFLTISSQPKASSTIASIASLVPTSISLNSIAISDEAISISGNTPDEKVLNQFLNNLKESQQFTNVGLTQLERDQEKEGLLRFSARFKYKIESNPKDKKQ